MIDNRQKDASVGNRAFDYFDHIYCVNLDHRPDRWEAVQVELDKLGVRVSENAASQSSLEWAQMQLRRIFVHTLGRPFWATKYVAERVVKGLLTRAWPRTVSGTR